MATSPEQFVAEARQALGERLKCVVLFGSAAAGDFLEGISQYDLLVVARSAWQSWKRWHP
jgi:predicted nucleotidyltransferase